MFDFVYFEIWNWLKYQSTVLHVYRIKERLEIPFTKKKLSVFRQIRINERKHQSNVISFNRTPSQAMMQVYWFHRRRAIVYSGSNSEDGSTQHINDTEHNSECVMFVVNFSVRAFHWCVRSLDLIQNTRFGENETDANALVNFKQ